MSLLGIIFLLIAAIIIISGSRQVFNILIRGHAPFVFSRPKIIKAILDNITIKPGEIFYELGAGTAPLARHLAKRYPHNQFFALEYAFIPYTLGKLLSSFHHNLAWQQTDFNQANLSLPDYLYCFLNVNVMRQLETKLLTECKDGAIVISYIFKLPNLTPTKTITVGHENVYFYTIKKIDKNN